MSIDTKRYKDKVAHQTPNINLVPLLDVIFTIMIFLLVVLSQHPLDQAPENYTQEQISSKPTTGMGDSEYYLLPLNGLKKVTVNGIDHSNDIRKGAIAVHTRVMDEGQIMMDSSTGTITIQSPEDLVDVAVKAPVMN
ncbi:MAG: biopolymer transporter ExbD [Methanosphaera sp.]|nr:biopolymer transporter ExbD [Methanosphaera sp.]